MVALPDSAVAILNHPQTFAHIATVNRDGSPHVTVVWIETVDGTISFNTERGRQKCVNLERDPRLMVSVQNPDNPWEYMAFQGTARLIDEGADEQINRLSQRYTGEDFDLSTPGVVRVRIEVDVEQITGYKP